LISRIKNLLKQLEYNNAMKKWFCFVLLISAFSLQANVIERYYFTSAGNAGLKSETPEELIVASTGQALAIVDPVKKTVVVRIPFSTFNNFSDKTRQDLFQNNIVEVQKYPDIVFTGRLPSDFSELKKGMQTVFVYGNLTAHGVRRERTIAMNIFMTDQLLVLNAIVSIPLAQHKMEVPKSFEKKVAREIRIDINARLRMKFASEIPDLNQ
jgi:hypothetical protein